MALRRVAISSSRQRASTWPLTSSSVRSRDGVMPDTEYQTLPPSVSIGSLSTPTSEPNAAFITLPRRPRFGERLALRFAAGDVDLVGGDRQLQLLRRLFERAAAGALVLDLVVDVPYLGLGAFGDDVLAYLRRDIGKRFVLCGLDLGDGHDGRAEAALDRRAHLALLERERGVGDGRIKDVRLRRHAEVEVLLLEPALGSERRETQALLEPGVGGLGLLHGREDDLLDVPLLRPDVTAAMLVEGAFDLLVGNLDPACRVRWACHRR